MQKAGARASASTGGAATARGAGARVSATREAATQVQGVRGLSDLRAREAAGKCKECGARACASTEKHICTECGARHLRAREATILLQGGRGSGICDTEAAKQVQGLPRRLTCCVFGTVFNTTGRYVSYPWRVRGRGIAPLRGAMER